MARPHGIFKVAVEAVIIKDGKILITQRSFDRPHAPGEWEILTGHVEQGETFEEALNREVMEEVGLKVNIDKPFNTFHFYSQHDNVEHQGVSFLCLYKGGKIVLDKNEQIAYKWATPEEAEKLITDPSILASVKKVKAFIK
jgi:8-oxo-dGTP diphosphatase